MASVKVAVRVRPFNQREIDLKAKLIIQMDGKKTRIINTKVKDGDPSRERVKDFTFDHSYWSFNVNDSHYAAQDEVFNDLGSDVIDSAFQGYNACVFAYGQTGSGKTYTMMGSPECQGLIPRICKTLFARMAAGKETGASYRTEVSYLEIYNERVKDLLRQNSSHSLRVREHPSFGPYVEGLSKHLVSDYSDIQEWMTQGNTQRTTARTNMNDTSSRSHAIFTITFVQADFSDDLPSETVSKVHLVDLAGSERADATGATGERLKEGAHINKSLVTLGLVISTLAKANGITHDLTARRSSSFIPYRDSVLTWLLKDSLGGNSKTIMIAAISPADVNYEETLSTLRYANRAKNIINKPTINEDPNVALIRTLRDEINKLKSMLTGQVTAQEPNVLAQIQQKEAKEKELTEEWTEKWRETRQILQEQRALGLRKSGVGVVLDSDRPHLVGIEDDLLSTGVTLYHLKDGETSIGTYEARVKQDIEISGDFIEPEHCSIILSEGSSWLHPKPQAQCWVNTVPVDRPVRLSQGCIILLGRTNMFRYNDPAEAAVLRKGGSRSHLNLSRLSQIYSSNSDLSAKATSVENLFCPSEDNNPNKDDIDNKLATFIRQRQEFKELKKEQEAQQMDWEREQKKRMEALEEEQKQIQQERMEMEAAYQAEREKLAADWQKLEQHQSERLALLAEREAEFEERILSLETERDEESVLVQEESKRIALLQANLLQHQKQFQALVADKVGLINQTEHSLVGVVPTLKSLAADRCPSSPDSESGFVKSDSWSNLLIDITDQNATHIQDIMDKVERHKQELAILEEELANKMSLVNERRLKIDKLNAELAEISKEKLSLPDKDLAELKQVLANRSEEELKDIREKKQSFSLELKSKACPDSSENGSDTGLMTSQTCRSSLETFHTALSPPADLLFSGNHLMSDSGVGLDAGSCRDTMPKSSSNNFDPLTSTPNRLSSDSDVEFNRNGVAKRRPCRSDSSDESLDIKLPKQRVHQFHKTKHLSKSCRTIYDDIGVSESYRAMKRLCQKVAAQKILIMQSLENDCGKEEIHRQITELQELQLQYVRLQTALELRREESEASESSANGYTDPLRRSYANGESPMSPVMFPSADQTEDVPYNYSLTRSLPSLRLPPDDDDELWLRIPSFVLRGAGRNTRYEYEIRLCTDGGERWTLMRRYRKFRELHLSMKAKYGAKVEVLNFPPRQWLPLTSESLARRRRVLLETYLRQLVEVCSKIRGCPLFGCDGAPTRHILVQFSPFFRKGLFEAGKYGTS